MDLLFACEIGFLNNYVDDVINMIPKDGKPESFIFFLDGDDDEEAQDIYKINGNEATIDIQGPLSKAEPSGFMKLRYGGTSYPSILKAIEAIKENPEVETVRLVMDTPGGVVTGLDEVWIGLRELAQSKRVIAENHGMIASAGYWIASAASQIVALSPGAETGSIGVQMVQIDRTKRDEMIGIKEVKILSKNSPKKNPDVFDKNGISLIQDRLDALERVFISRIAEGRGVSREKVISDFGQGALLIAEDPDAKRDDALSVGMIDKVLNTSLYKATETTQENEDIFTQDQRDGSKVQTLIFDKKVFPQKQSAIKWAKDHNFRADKVDETENSWRLRQRDPGDFIRMRTIELTKGVKAVVGPLKKGKATEKDNESTRHKSAETNNMEVREMSELERLCSENPALVGEVQKIEREAFGAGAASIATRINAAIPFLTSDTYSKPIKELAVRVLKGEADKGALEGAVAVYDSMKEEQASAAAATESEKSGEVESAAGDELSSDGIMRTEADYQAAIAAHKAAQGREV